MAEKLILIHNESHKQWMNYAQNTKCKIYILTNQSRLLISFGHNVSKPILVTIEDFYCIFKNVHCLCIYIKTELGKGACAKHEALNINMRLGMRDNCGF